MSKWKMPTREQAEAAVDLGLDPEGIAVSEVGEDAYIILHFKSGNEYYVGTNRIIGTDRLGGAFFSTRKPQKLSETGGIFRRHK